MQEFLQQTLLVEERTESARSAYMHDKISDALEDNNNFWKEIRKLGLLPTADGALHGFSPDELNTQLHILSHRQGVRMASLTR